MALLFTSLACKYTSPPHLHLWAAQESGSDEESSGELVPVFLTPVCHPWSSADAIPRLAGEHKGSLNSVPGP